MREAINQVLWDLRVPGKYAGFRQISRAIELVVQDEDRLLNINRDVYEVIAREYHITAKSVEKNIRTLLEAAWKRGCRERFEQLAGYTYETRPTVGEFLDIVSTHCRKDRLLASGTP